jgi:hypothetical protein
VIALGVDAITLFNIKYKLLTMSSQTTIDQNNNNNSMQNHYSVQVVLKVLNANNNKNVTVDDNNNIYGSAKRHFIICNSCFWCASLYSDLRTIKCPGCNYYSNLESIPISENESFKFNYHSRTGIVLEFSRY